MKKLILIYYLNKRYKIHWKKEIGENKYKKTLVEVRNKVC